MGQIFDRYDVSVMSMERHTSTLSCHRHCHFMTVPAHFIHETGLLFSGRMAAKVIRRTLEEAAHVGESSSIISYIYIINTH